MTIKSAIETVWLNLKHFGVTRTVYVVALRALNLFLFFKILKVVRLSKSSTVETLPTKLDFREISVEEFRRISEDGEYKIGPIPLREIAQGGNVCFGLFDNGVLANYLLMYATSAQMTEDLEIHFDSHYGYLCNTFTHPNYRGLHLNSIAVGMGAKEFLARGFRGLLAYVESDNFSSLKSLYRIGWKDVGTIYILRVFGCYFIRASSGCAPYGFHVRVVPRSA